MDTDSRTLQRKGDITGRESCETWSDLNVKWKGAPELKGITAIFSPVYFITLMQDSVIFFPPPVITRIVLIGFKVKNTLGETTRV